MSLPPPPRGTVAVYSDLGCPWARLCVHRLHRARRRLGLEEAVTLEHRPFPLELVNRRPTPRRVLDVEVAVIAGLDEEVAWRPWDAPDATWPVTTLPAMEAVQAAAEQGVRVAERLDLALRDAFFLESRCISMLHVILDVAASVEGLDAGALEAALGDGRARGRVRRAPAEVMGSPHLVLPDGDDLFNPGMRMHDLPGDIPVVEANDPAAVEEAVRRAAAAGGR